MRVFMPPERWKDPHALEVYTRAEALLRASMTPEQVASWEVTRTFRVRARRQWVDPTTIAPGWALAGSWATPVTALTALRYASRRGDRYEPVEYEIAGVHHYNVQALTPRQAYCIHVHYAGTPEQDTALAVKTLLESEGDLGLFAWIAHPVAMYYGVAAATQLVAVPADVALPEVTV